MLISVQLTIPRVTTLGRIRVVSPRIPWVVSPRVVSPSFIDGALKNEIWKIPLQIFVFWMFTFISYLLTLPLFVGVSPVRALSPAWTGSRARETLISRTHIFLPHDSPQQKIKYNKILTYILRSIFQEIPHLELPRWWKMPRDTNGKGV